MNPQGRGQQTEYVLRENQLFRLRKAKGQRLECVTGLVLITLYGEADDVTLRAGEILIIPNHGLALIETIGRGKIALTTAPDAQFGSKLSWLRKIVSTLNTDAYQPTNLPTGPANSTG